MTTPLPNADRAFVDPAKITAYLLSPTHKRGQHKAAFFRSFGFDLNNWELLRDALLEHARTNAVVRTEPTSYGMMYEMAGRLVSPDGRNPNVLVVWTIRHGEDFPRLVSAVPS